MELKRKNENREKWRIKSTGVKVWGVGGGRLLVLCGGRGGCTDSSWPQHQPNHISDPEMSSTCCYIIYIIFREGVGVSSANPLVTF